MHTATVNEAAKHFNVTPQTVRDWIGQGMPVVKLGTKGAGNTSVIDMVRAALWVAKKRRSPVPCWAELFNEMSPGLRNPLRWVAEEFFEGGSAAVAAACATWHKDDRTTGGRDWQDIGLTDEQARAVAWSVWAHCALFLLNFKLEHFEKRVEGLSDGMTLDDLASLWFSGEIESEWKETVNLAPKPIEPYVPQRIRERAENGGIG